MDSLAALAVKPGDKLSAERWDELVKAIMRRLPLLGNEPPDKTVFNHPFKVTAALDPAASNDDGRAWQVFTNTGCINDQCVAIAYRAQGDPRGWKPPATVDPVKTPVVDRLLLETEDPPYFALKTPAIRAAATNTDQFQPVADSARPAFFRTEEMWHKLLFQSYVVATAEPKVLVSPDLPALILSRLPNRFRIRAGRLPVTPVAQAGGQIEIARLYLLRDDDAKDTSSDEIMVRQFVFWDLAEAFVQPANPLDNYGEAGAYGDLSEQEIAALFAAAATVQWWTM